MLVLGIDMKPLKWGCYLMAKFSAFWLELWFFKSWEKQSRSSMDRNLPDKKYLKIRPEHIF